MLERPSRYLLASPRIDLIEEREHDLKLWRQTPGRHLSFVSSIAAGPSRPVPERITEAIEKYQDDEHVILLITHEGMMGADLSDLAGWHVRIDEIPMAVVTDKVAGSRQEPSTSRKATILTPSQDQVVEAQGPGRFARNTLGSAG